MKLIAHRSGPTVLPEQTIPSARLALQSGADMVEVDTRFTADNRIAVCHDDSAGRVFGVDKRICDMTAQEFRSLRHTDDPAFPSHLLEDYLRCGIAPLLLHIKESGDRLPLLLDCLKRHEYLDKVVFGVQQTEGIAVIRDFYPRARILAFMPAAENADEFIEKGADYIRLWEQWITEIRIKQILDAGREVWVMANNPELGFAHSSPEILRGWKEMGISGVLLNDIRPGLEI